MNDNPYDKQKLIREQRLSREAADANREGYFALHQRQKGVFNTQADRLDNFESGPGIQLDSASRLRFYVSLLDPNLGPFINNAQSKAKQAYLTGTRNWHHHYTIDVADVDIKLRGRAVHIKIEPADQFYFEFVSSAKPVVNALSSQGGDAVPTYNAVVVGVDVRIKNQALITTPTILKQRRDTLGQKLSTIARPFQVQLLNEPAAYPQAEYKFGRYRTKRIQFEGYTPGHSWTHAVQRSTDGPFSPFIVLTAFGPHATFWARDRFFDMPWGDHQPGKGTRLAYIRGAADWPRASGMQVVEDKLYGSREFAIYVDDFNQFMVFPTSEIGPNKGVDGTDQNVPETVVRRPALTLPGWCVVPTEKGIDYNDTHPDNASTWPVDQPEFDWKFNHLGTKCAAIVFEREAYSYDSTFWSTNINADQPFTSAKFDALASWFGVQTSFVSAFSTDTYNPQRYFTAPGVVEVEVKITLTGPDAGDFVAELTPRVVRRPSADGDKSRWPLFIDYVWFDIPKRTNTNVEVKKGALVALDIDYWVNPRGTNGELTDRQVLLNVRDMNTTAEVCSVVGSPILAVDLKTLSFVLRLDGYTQEQRTCAKVTGGSTNLNFVVHHFGAMVVHSGVPKEVVYPDNTPDDVKLLIDGYAKLNGLDYLQSRPVNGGDGWRYVSPTTVKDGWADVPLSNYRNWWAFQQWFWYDQWYAFIDPDVWFYGSSYPTEGYVKYKTSGSPPSFPSDGTATEKWLTALGGDFRNLMFCTSPRWGWHQYIGLTPGYMCADANCTFYTHPNGTYAFWCDGWIYDRNGLPGDYTNKVGPGATSDAGLGSGLDYLHDALATYDPLKVSMAVLDRIHFEIRAKDQKAKTRNTTFMDLYNRAVALGLEAKTLAENILIMTKADLQPTFVKEIGSLGDYSVLDLKMTWSGHDWWMHEGAYSMVPTYSSPFFPPMVPAVGGFNNLNTYGNWRRTNIAGGGSYKSPGYNVAELMASWHIRFADPIVIMEK